MLQQWVLMLVLFGLIVAHNRVQVKRKGSVRRDQVSFYSFMGLALYLTVSYLLRLDWPEMQDAARWTMLDMGKAITDWLEGK